MKISDIFQEFGEDRFRKMETAFFIEKAKQTGNVFSTGGGIVLGNENRKILKNNGITFFLNTSTDKLANRINNSTNRPLLNDSENHESRLKQIWEVRKSFYKGSAHHTINTDNLNPEQVLDEILNLLEVPLANH
jgi:shikimate kinase